MAMVAWVPLLVLEEGRLRRASLRDYVEAVRVIASLIPTGKAATYAAIARLLRVSPRLVGRALSLNPDPIVYPCHRVVASDGTLGGYSVGGPGFKERLLRLEGVEFDSRGRILRQHIVSEAEDLLDP